MAELSDRTARMADFLAATPWAASNRTLVAGDASNRRYDRLTRPDGSTAILMDAPPEKGEDVRPFIRIANYLVASGLSAPKLLEADEAQGFLIIEDLGDDLYASLMALDASLEQPLYAAAIDVLVHLHRADPLDLPPCDPVWMAGMNRLIFDWYAQDTPTGARAAFDDAFRPLAQSLEETPKVVILRDYHAQNLLWLPDRQGVARVGQLDFQDALLGHPAYDVVSILQDARRDVSPLMETQMIDRYLAATGMDQSAFERAYAILGAQRNLCILGIFARLCQRDGKAHYVDLIPRVWNYVLRDLAHPDLARIAQVLGPILPEPTPDFLNRLKSRCATSPS
ncbi:MAG: phosphotransferase [Sulfitobacter sp.]|nr:phosphotransferase [Sulfitobacter sp.]